MNATQSQDWGGGIRDTLKVTVKTAEKFYNANYKYMYMNRDGTLSVPATRVLKNID